MNAFALMKESLQLCIRDHFGSISCGFDFAHGVFYRIPISVPQFLTSLLCLKSSDQCFCETSVFIRPFELPHCIDPHLPSFLSSIQLISPLTLKNLDVEVASLLSVSQSLLNFYNNAISNHQASPPSLSLHLVLHHSELFIDHSFRKKFSDWLLNDVLYRNHDNLNIPSSENRPAIFPFDISISFCPRLSSSPSLLPSSTSDCSLALLLNQSQSNYPSIFSPFNDNNKKKENEDNLKQQQEQKHSISSSHHSFSLSEISDDSLVFLLDSQHFLFGEDFVQHLYHLHSQSLSSSPLISSLSSIDISKMIENDNKKRSKIQKKVVVEEEEVGVEDNDENENENENEMDFRSPCFSFLHSSLLDVNDHMRHSPLFSYSLGDERGSMTRWTIQNQHQHLHDHQQQPQQHQESRLTSSWASKMETIRYFSSLLPSFYSSSSSSSLPHTQSSPSSIPFSHPRTTSEFIESILQFQSSSEKKTISLDRLPNEPILFVSPFPSLSHELPLLSHNPSCSLSSISSSSFFASSSCVPSYDLLVSLKDLGLSNQDTESLEDILASLLRY